MKWSQKNRVLIQTGTSNYTYIVEIGHRDILKTVPVICCIKISILSQSYFCYWCLLFTLGCNWCWRRCSFGVWWFCCAVLVCVWSCLCWKVAFAMEDIRILRTYVPGSMRELEWVLTPNIEGRFLWSWGSAAQNLSSFHVLLDGCNLGLEPNAK